jgi:hypothetical protein
MTSLKSLLRWIFSWRGLAVLFLFLFFVAPAFQSARVEVAREEAIRAVEEKRGSRAIVLIHREESVNAKREKPPPVWRAASGRTTIRSPPTRRKN